MDKYSPLGVNYLSTFSLILIETSLNNYIRIEKKNRILKRRLLIPVIRKRLLRQ